MTLSIKLLKYATWDLPNTWAITSAGYRGFVWQCFAPVDRKSTCCFSCTQQVARMVHGMCHSITHFLLGVLHSVREIRWFLPGKLLFIQIIIFDIQLLHCCAGEDNERMSFWAHLGYLWPGAWGFTDGLFIQWGSNLCFIQTYSKYYLHYGNQRILRNLYFTDILYASIYSITISFAFIYVYKIFHAMRFIPPRPHPKWPGNVGKLNSSPLKYDFTSKSSHRYLNMIFHPNKDRGDIS